MSTTEKYSAEQGFPETEAKKEPFMKMKALQWMGNAKTQISEVPKPAVTEKRDAIIRVTSSTICGSDLHLYHGEFKGMQKGDILGHECMGKVESVGDGVKDLKVGDRVVVSAVIADGTCTFCKQGKFSLCDNTNPSVYMEKMYGHRTAGIFGYSHLTGGYAGGQAQYVRVPFADVNCLKVPNHLSDEQVLLLSDVLCTGFHGTELGEVKEGQTVAVWGCGPIGLSALMWAKYKGAKRIIGIDCIPYRLEIASKILGAETINFSKDNTVDTLEKMVPGGPDVCIECAGFRFPTSWLHKFERALKLETDTPQILEECILSCKKGGNISIIGDYMGYANQFPIGPMMEKNLTVRGGQVFVQKYWKDILALIENGKIDPGFLVTHKLPLEKAPEAYNMFDSKEENVLKIILKPFMKETTVTGTTKISQM